jgi:plastocyanin
MRFRRPLLVIALVTVVALATVAAFSAADRVPTREVVVVARGMAFYLEGETVPNPVIRVFAGERVRLTVRNDAAGYVHDLAADAIGLAVDPLATGERRTVTFIAPVTPGRYQYVCRPHAAMMSGWIDVAPR